MSRVPSISTAVLNAVINLSKFSGLIALREENRLLFECGENEQLVRSAGSKDEYFSAESLFMVLILQQQKTINELIAKVSEGKNLK